MDITEAEDIKKRESQSRAKNRFSRLVVPAAAGHKVGFCSNPPCCA